MFPFFDLFIRNLYDEKITPSPYRESEPVSPHFSILRHADEMLARRSELTFQKRAELVSHDVDDFFSDQSKKLNIAKPTYFICSPDRYGNTIIAISELFSMCYVSDLVRTFLKSLTEQFKSNATYLRIQDVRYEEYSVKYQQPVISFTFDKLTEPHQSDNI